MASYNVYITPKEGLPENEFLEKIHLFMKDQISTNLLLSYRILKITEKVNFEELPEYHVIADYENEDKVKEAFSSIAKDGYNREPHKTLMSMTSEFRISFSSDV